MAVCLFLIILYFSALILEKKRNDRALASFRYVIHVNGIRGKTSTCRYLDAALRGSFKVFTKTTGTDAAVIGVDGVSRPVRRLGPANIHEQLRIIQKAYRQGAEVLILECMAVNPQLQKAAQELIVKSDITVITNVRHDHIFDMGQSLPEIAAALSSTIPENGVLFTADPRGEEFFSAPCREKNCRLVCCPPLGTQEESRELACTVAGHLGVGEEQLAELLPRTQQDFGTMALYPMKNSRGQEIQFLNLFSVNDPRSTKNNIDRVRKPGQPLCFLYNHRSDRADRAVLFARHFFPEFKDCPVYVTGPGSALALRLFRTAGVETLRRISPAEFSFDLPAGGLLVGVGNIKGAGYQMIRKLEQEKERHE